MTCDLQKKPAGTLGVTKVFNDIFFLKQTAILKVRHEVIAQDLLILKEREGNRNTVQKYDFHDGKWATIEYNVK